MIDYEEDKLIDMKNHSINSLEDCIDNPKNKKDFYLALSLGLGNAADAVEILCVGFIMTEIDSVSSLDKEFLTAAVFMGMLIGGVFSGYLSDKVGRKPCLMYTFGLNFIAGVISAFSPSIPFLITFRLIAGIGIGGSVPIVFSLGTEMFPTPKRGQYLSIVASFWMVGAIFTSFIAWIMLGDDYYGNKIIPFFDWRWFAIICSFPALLTFIMTFYFIPESPRFLIGKGRNSEALMILNDWSIFNINESDLNEYSNQHRISNEDSMNKYKSKAKSTIGLLLSKDIMIDTIVLLIIWFTLSFGTYGISTWISTLFEDVGIGNAYAASFIFAIANFPGNLISILYVEKFGRRWLLSVGMCLAAVSVLGFAFGTKIPALVVTCASLFNAFSVIGWNSLDCLSAEIFPTNIRTSAMGILTAAGRVGAISAQFVNGSLESNVPLLLFVTSACTVFGGMISWLLPNDSSGILLAETEQDVQNENRLSKDITFLESVDSPIETSAFS